MRILVTGGAGFIGSHVVQRLRDDGHQIRVLDALLPEVYGDQPAPVPDDVEFIHGDLRDEQAVASALRGIELVSHQAALVGRGREILDAPRYTACNDLGTAVLLAEMTRLGTSRLILGSSVVLYGEAQYECAAHGPVVPGLRAVEDLAAGRFENRCPKCREALCPRAVDETAPADPRSVYALTKLAQEHLAQVWSRETGATSVALRYHNVYGAGMPMDSAYSGVASTFRSAIAAGVAPEVYEDGAPLRDFIDVRDVAAANAAALSWPGSGFRAFNVATGAPRSVAELAGCLAVAAGAPTPVISGRYRLGDVRHIIASPDRLVRELGWRPAIAFEEGVTEFASAPLRTVGRRRR